MPVSLDKKIAKLNLDKKSPKLVSLAKKASVSLEKKGFSAHEAQVALIMDISGSMKPLFQNGTVQELIARTMALGLILMIMVQLISLPLEGMPTISER